MPAFHASLASTGQAIGKVAIMPLKQTSKGCPRGPAPVTEEEEDIVDQTINLFKVQRISRLLFQYVSAVAAERRPLPVTCHVIRQIFSSPRSTWRLTWTASWSTSLSTSSSVSGSCRRSQAWSAGQRPCTASLGRTSPFPGTLAFLKASMFSAPSPADLRQRSWKNTLPRLEHKIS